MATPNSHQIVRIAAITCLFSLLLTLSGAQQQQQNATTVPATSTDNSNHQQCLDETLVLENNTLLIASAPPMQNCHIELGSSDNSCSVDFSTVSADYERTCRDVGGRLHIQDLVLDCTVTNPIDFRTENADFFFYNHVSCHGRSCDATEIQRTFDTVVYPAIESSLSGSGFSCQVSSDADSASASSASASSASASSASASSAITSSGRSLPVLLVAMVGISSLVGM